MPRCVDAQSDDLVVPETAIRILFQMTYGRSAAGDTEPSPRHRGV
jgi:hypothetical protein